MSNLSLLNCRLFSVARMHFPQFLMDFPSLENPQEPLRCSTNTHEAMGRASDLGLFGLHVQDMNTRLSANLDSDSRLQHVSCCVPDECPDSGEFRVDSSFFSVFGSEPRSHVWFGCDERFTWLVVLTRTPVFCPWYLGSLGQQRWNLVNMREHLNDPEHLCNSVSFCLACLSQHLDRYRED